MTHPEYLILVLGMAIVTYLPRWLPVILLTQRNLPEWFVEWLNLIPVAILSALIFGELFVSSGSRHLDFLNTKSLAAIPTFLFAIKTKSLGGTVVLGMLLFWALERVL